MIWKNDRHKKSPFMHKAQRDPVYSNGLFEQMKLDEVRTSLKLNNGLLCNLNNSTSAGVLALMSGTN